MDIQDFFDEIDILVVPFFSEAWPLVVFEGMSMELIPVITSECSLKEILEDGQNCYFMDPFSENDLYGKLEYIILNYDEVQSEIIKNNRELLKKYDFNGEFKKKLNNIFE